MSGRARVAWAAVVPITATAGGLVPINLPAALGTGGVAVSLLVLALGRRATTLFLVTLLWALVGYGFLGRGFSYLGIPPVYVGEVLLLLGGLALVTALPTRRLGLVHWLILAFMAWGAARTAPYLGAYGIDALRDAVAWGYAAFAILLSLLLRRVHLRRLVRFYGSAIPIFVIWALILVVIWFGYRGIIPLVPGTNVAIPHFKPGDAAVHLAGAAAFILVGLYSGRGWRRLTQPLLWAAWIAAAVIVSALNRGGMLALGAAAATALFFRPSLGRWGTAVLVLVLLVGIVGIANPEIDIGQRRTISADQLVANVESILGEPSEEGLADTRQWREDWWDAILGYTVHGPLFWEGKGYGINLAQDDGVTAPDITLRAPHNAHLGILARSGVPGLALWIGVQGAFAFTMLRAAFRAGQRKHRARLAVLGWIFVYWVAAIVNMSFDVYLEGPQGGILFWSLMGVGLAVSAHEPKARQDAPIQGGYADVQPGGVRSEPASRAASRRDPVVHRQHS